MVRGRNATSAVIAFSVFDIDNLRECIEMVRERVR
ncbi:hypothetical protein SULPSESMR1_00180 [Pseudosulfitobacter pseudonitzschiae]|uniref:Uncharacterized protein n=1 Tax=Pseudosulfitobacter pseudonitzschiae TaxID=1402135 RepID=A0A221JWA1_9RHOB|nr:hypothetical protein SULPSESMR1_00180 [Pseudosulfitobacter pseudonitzschiae]